VKFVSGHRHFIDSFHFFFVPIRNLGVNISS